MAVHLKKMNDPKKDGFLWLAAYDMPLAFDIRLEIQENAGTQVRLVFEAPKISMFIKPMIEKPLKNLFASLSDKVEKYFQKKI